MKTLLTAFALQVPRGTGSGAPGDSLVSASDSLGAAAGAVHDTLTRAPLPGGLAALFRFLFQVPQWIQIAGAAAGAIVVLLVLRFIWRQRRDILAWLTSRSRQVQIGLAVGVLVVLTAAAATGAKSWDFMQHDNGFCTGCHIMEAPFQRFAAGAGKHQKLKCHDCHQQSIFASSRQLVLWVAQRPEKIGLHAQVPNSRCRSCHEQAGKEKWQHAMRLAGHKAHFDSDSSALAGLACVKCHGAEVHKFIPSGRTCGQSGCHEKQPVKLAGMAKLPEINCVTCHAFTAELPGLASRDSAVKAMLPRQEQCLSCHQMQGKPKGLDLTKDPHQGSCGFCHDVHAHTVPADARTSCKTCHANVAQSSFHQGVNHRRVVDACLTCHQPHQASVDAADCAGCHAAVRARGLFKPPMPFDTNAVKRRAVPPPQPAGEETAPGLNEHRGKGDALPEELPPPRDSPAPPPAAARDSFPHNRHTSLACLTCHTTNRPGSGLVFQAPRGCDLCHHQKVIAGAVAAADCVRCHAASKLAAPRSTPVSVRIPARTAQVRAVGFRHERHSRIACADCHWPPAAEPPDSVRTCQACHAQHHEAGRDCAQCHNRAETPPAHTRASHTGCDACHTPARVAALLPTRPFCLT
ncbi:MAG TPA: hypothetical protein VFU23_01320, partial [Gemmatimonadales bacterium]|nr:hypothetical protein [Gemmatimonadales bacterium]